MSSATGWANILRIRGGHLLNDIHNLFNQDLMNEGQGQWCRTEHQRESLEIK